MKPGPKPDLLNPLHFLAFGFGSGLAPKAPGTLGTLAAVPLYWFLSPADLYWYLLVCVLVFAIGVPICGRASSDLGVHDHSGIVWDEIAGYFVTMIAIPQSLFWATVGFMLFRLFDIWKPWPISWLDRRVSGGFGIMVDDLLAGLMACGLMHLLLYMEITPLW
ncbi:MAG: phosphatidylglycerophosphatase A [Chromatiales bacterium]|jgi:phosphatidylglycerophosphatase A